MAYYRIRLLDNQNYCFQDDENGNHLLCSQSDRVELQVRKEWLCRQGWDNLASRVSQAFAEHSVLFLRDNDYEHTSQTFFTTYLKGGNSFGIQTSVK